MNLNDAPSWKIPVEYQIGITYERLMQPQKAMESYNQIFSLETALGTNSTPTLQTVFDMSRWRTNFLSWQNKVETLNQTMMTPGDDNLLPAATNSPPAEVTSK